MSKMGDVVWADGKSWQRDDDHASGPKEWWIAPKSDPSTLQALKEHSDFRWLVKNGELVDEMYYEGKLDAWETAKLILGFTDKHRSFAHALDGQRKQAVQAERAAIVAWLSSKGWESELAYAEAIERGEHLRGEHVKKTDKTLHDDKTCKESCYNERHSSAKQPATDTHFILLAEQVDGIWQSTCSCGFVVRSPSEWNEHVEVFPSSISTVHTQADPHTATVTSKVSLCSPPINPATSRVVYDINYTSHTQPHMSNQHEQLDQERQAVDRGIKYGRKFERNDIVTWMKELPSDVFNVQEIASRIEQGEHVRQEEQ